MGAARFRGCNLRRLEMTGKIDRFQCRILRNATQDDLDQYFEWLNDPELMRVSGRIEQVGYTSHCRWFSQNLKDPSNLMYILADGQGGTIGQVNFKKELDEWILGFHIVPSFRGKGLGLEIVKRGLEELEQYDSHARHVYAYIREENRGSRLLVEKVLFEMIGLEISPSKVRFCKYARKMASCSI